MSSLLQAVERSLTFVQKVLPSPEGHIPENILAFRTITTWLEGIQRQRPFKLVEDAGLQHELRLSTAFSTVAVINHEVVAVVAKDNGGILEVIVCINHSPDQSQQITTQTSSNSIISNVSTFLFAKNIRRDESQVKNNQGGKTARDEPRKVPIIKNTETPPGLEPGYEGIKVYLEKRW